MARAIAAAALAIAAACCGAPTRCARATLSQPQIAGILRAFCQAEQIEAARAEDAAPPVGAIAQQLVDDQVVRLYHLEQLEVETITSPAAELAIATAKHQADAEATLPAGELGDFFLSISTASHAARIALVRADLLPPTAGDLRHELEAYLEIEARHQLLLVQKH